MLVLCRCWDGPGLSFRSYNSFSFWEEVCDALETDSTVIPLLCKENQKVSEVDVCLLRN